VGYHDQKNALATAGMIFLHSTSGTSACRQSSRPLASLLRQAVRSIFSPLSGMIASLSLTNAMGMDVNQQSR
jgi:hypothetical protein